MHRPECLRHPSFEIATLVAPRQMNMIPSLHRRCAATIFTFTLVSAAMLTACGGGGDANDPAASAGVGKGAGFGSMVVDSLSCDPFTEANGNGTATMVAVSSAEQRPLQPRNRGGVCEAGERIRPRWLDVRFDAK